mmetsp:Transcript_54847/g.64129  ORF Transcript_54847/g.64129 Transcript_54847/m.64129 type:complete len:542 (+) Transcript_54847:78-1703(+)
MATADSTSTDKRTMNRQTSRRRSRSPKTGNILKSGKRSIKGLITGKSRRNMKKNEASSTTTTPVVDNTSTISEDISNDDAGSTTSDHVEPTVSSESAKAETTPTPPEPVAPTPAAPTPAAPTPAAATPAAPTPVAPEPVITATAPKPDTKVEEISTPMSPRPSAQDDETVYGVQVDDQSVMSEAPSLLNSKEEVPERTIQVVLLTMDPKTKRFELLQLEFDPEKALTSDVIAQIKSSATEQVLRDLEYVGICDSNGKKLDGAKMLNTYCPEGNEILMALPKGTDAKRCTKLANPILKDPSVLAMLKPSTGSRSAEESKGSPVKANGNPVPQSEEKVKAEAPVVNTKTASKSLTPVPEVVKEEPKSRAISPSESEEETNIPQTGFKYCLLIVLLLVGAKYFEMNGPETKSLEVGSTLVAGDILSKCDKWDLIRPPRFQTCKDPMTLEIGEDGVLTLYNGGPWRLWEGDAGHLPLIEMVAKNASGDVEIGEDGILKIGGQVAKITYFSANAPTELAPWPFAVELSKKNGKKKKSGKQRIRIAK